MVKRVQVGSDTLEFPDGMADADISAAIDREYAAPKVAAPVEPPPLRADDALGAQVALKRPLDNLAIMADKYIPGAKSIDDWAHTHFGLPTADQAAAATQAHIDEAAKQGRRPGVAGEIGGSIVSGIPIAAATGNPFLAGAVIGGANTSDPKDASGTAFDTGLGAVTGGVGDMAARGIGSWIAPRLHPFVKSLLKQGVELTPGQVLGGAMHRVEDASRSILGLGDAVIGAQNRAEVSLNRVAAQRVLDPLGIKIPKDVPEGHEQIKYVGDKLSGAYDAVLADIDRQPIPVGPGVIPHGMPLPTGLKIDPPFAQNVASLRKMAQGLPHDQQRVFEGFVQNDLRSAVNPQTNSMSGRTMKDLDEKLGREIRAYKSAPNPDQRKLGGAFQELQAELRDMVGRQFPQHAKTIGALNQGWAALTRVETGAANTRTGTMSADALRRATYRGDSSMRHRASARGEALMQDLGKEASTVMHATVGDSGTATRVIPTALATAALFSKSNLHNISINPLAAAALGTFALPYLNKTAGSIVRAAISKRPPGAAQARAAFEKVARPALTALGAQEPARQRGQ